MSTFTGSLREFERYVGPRFRNLIQTSIARSYKEKIGKCEKCGAVTELDAAHIHGKDRKTMIRNALASYMNGDTISNADLDKVEQNFRDLHANPSNIFRILCKKCHREYDKIAEELTLSESSDSSDKNETIIQDKQITFYPEDMNEFKELLLQRKKAIISINYNDDQTAKKIWNASNMKSSSNILRNLRSRNEFRKEQWDKSNIKNIHVEIDLSDI